MKFKTKLSKWLQIPTLSEECKASLKERFKNPEEVEVERRFFAPQVEPEEKGESLKEGEHSIIQYVSTRDLDRDNEILLPSGCDLSEFKKSPSVLWGHNYSLPPIGKDIWIRKDIIGVKAKTEYAPTERGEEVWQLRKGRFLNTSSVGFIPLESTTPSKDNWQEVCDEIKKWWPEFSKIMKKVTRIITKWLLLEHSDVSVPANINALTVAVAKGEIELGDEIRKELSIPSDKYIKTILSLAAKTERDIIKGLSEGEPTGLLKQATELTEEEIKKIEKDARQAALDTLAYETIEKEVKNGEPYSHLKPFPNEHACRLHHPGAYDKFRRTGRESDGKEYFIIWGRKKSDNKWEEQSYRYPKKTWPVATARSHCKAHNGILFEPAKESRRALPFTIRPLPKEETPTDRKGEIEEAVKDEFSRLKGRV